MRERPQVYREELYGLRDELARLFNLALSSSHSNEADVKRLKSMKAVIDYMQIQLRKMSKRIDASLSTLEEPTGKHKVKR